MSSAENDKAREENALDAMIVAAFKELPAEAGDADIERYRNSLTDDDRRKLDDAGKVLINSLFTGEIKSPNEPVPETFATAMNRGEEGTALTDRASEEMERKIREARERREDWVLSRKIQEHDMVRVRSNLQVEGYSLPSGMVGTVVSVYREGEAFAVEFPELENGSAVVTLYRDQVELIEAKG